MIRISFFLILLTGILLFPKWSFAQNDWVIEGKVQDSLKQNLAHCLVYLSTDESKAFLAFKYSDEQGKFKLDVPAEVDTVMLYARMLGYKTYSTLLFRSIEQPILISLREEKIRIREVIIEGERPPIIEKSDTTIFDAKQFTDSTEFAVEDLLKKIPGIEVKADGTISVNGQSIKKVLIEGDDLFGNQYTIGTRNIRAEYIDQVEVFRRYQENPVLKDVNLSDDIAINLTIKEEKKNIINGIANLGSGWGKELKGTLHANVFSISKQTKVILLSDNGNTGNHYGFQDLTSDYILSQDQDNQASIIESPRFINGLDTENPGVPRSFIDNGFNQFSSIRGIHKLNKNWNLHLNGVFSQKNDVQTLLERTSFAFDDIEPYNINLQQKNELKKIFLSSNAQLNYLNDQQTTSFNSYFSWEKAKDFGAQTVSDNINNNFNFTNEDLFFSAIFSQKVNDNSVGQLQVKFEHLKQLEGLKVANEDLISYFKLGQGSKSIWQNIDFSSQKIEILSKYLFSKNQTIFKLEPFFNAEQSLFTNNIFSPEENINVLGEAFHKSEVSLNSYGLNLQLQQKIVEQILLDWKTKVAQNQVTHFTDNTQLLVFSTQLRFSYFLTGSSKGSITYLYGNSDPTIYDFWTTPYLANQFALYQPELQNRLRQRHEVSLNFNNRGTLNFRNYYFSIKYKFGGQEWNNSPFFERSLMIVRPFLAQDNRSFRFIGNFEQFIPGITTNLIVGSSYLNQQNRGIFQEIMADVHTQTARLRVDLKTKVNQKINILLKSSLSHFKTSSSVMEANLAQTTLLETRVEALYKEKKWSLALIFSRNTTIGDSGQNMNLVTSQFKFSKAISLRKQKANLELHINNLFNTGTFDSIQNTATFIYLSSIPAIPRFFLLKLDFAF